MTQTTPILSSAPSATSSETTSVITSKQSSTALSTTFELSTRHAVTTDSFTTLQPLTQTSPSTTQDQTTQQPLSTSQRISTMTVEHTSTQQQFTTSEELTSAASTESTQMPSSANSRHVDTDPCVPNPCKGDCSCHLSCRSEGGYICTGNSGRLGKHCEIDPAVVTCKSDKITVEVPDDLVTSYSTVLGNVSLYISGDINQPWSKNCKVKRQALKGGYYIAIPHPFQSCSTRANYIGSERTVSYQNSMWLNFKRDSKRGFDIPIPILNFSCIYSVDFNVSINVGPVLSKTDTPSLVKTHKAAVEVTLCKQPVCGTSQCPHNMLVAPNSTYAVGEVVHATISTMHILKDFRLFLDKVYLMCDGNESESMKTSLQIFENGCQTNDGVLVKASTSWTPLPQQVCYSFTLPRFTTPCKQLFIHSKVRMCNSNKSRKCLFSDSYTCSELVERRKREVGEKTTNEIVNGPYYLVEPDDLSQSAQQTNKIITVSLIFIGSAILLSTSIVIVVVRYGNMFQTKLDITTSNQNLLP